MLKKIMGAAASAAVLGTVLFATPAQASDAGGCTKAQSPYKACAGTVQFEDNGDWFYLYDNEADGAGVHLHWYKNGVLQPAIYYGGGAGTWGKFQRNAPAGTLFKFEVCIETNNVVFVNTCSGPIVATAG